VELKLLDYAVHILLASGESSTLWRILPCQLIVLNVKLKQSVYTVVDRIFVNRKMLIVDSDTA